MLNSMALTDSRIELVTRWRTRKLATSPGTGMSTEQIKALEEELNAANL